MRTSVLSVLLLLQSFGIASAQSNPVISRSAEEVEKAKQFLALEMYDDAQQALSAALDVDKFNAAAHYYLGELWFDRKNWEKSRDEFRIAQNLESDSLAAVGRLAAVAAILFETTKQGDYRLEAARCANAFLKRADPPRHDPYLDAVMMAKLVEQVRQIRQALLSLSGEWTTPQGAVFTLMQTDNSGSVTVIPGTPERPGGFGTLRKTSSGLFEGEVVMAGCMVDLSLGESEDGLSLSGTARMSRKSSRGCRSLLTKAAKSGAPFPYTLLRR